MNKCMQLQNEISDLETLIKDAQELLKDHPDDEVIQFQLKQLRSRQRKLLAELEILKLKD